VESVAMTMSLPLTGWDPNGSFHIEGGGTGNAHYRVVSPEFFRTLRIGPRAGRLFDERDRAGALDVVVINEALAARYFPGEDPVGRRISTGGMDSRQDALATIVGVVSDVRHRDPTTRPGPGYYLPYMQRPDRIGQAALLVRRERHSAGLEPALRAGLRTLDADVPVEVATLRGLAGEGLADRRLALYLLGGFAAVALALAAIGIYSVVAFAVAQRTREIGIRTALGAGAARVVWAISRGTMISVVLGLITGLLLATALTRLTAGLLFEVEPLDPLTFGGVTAVLLLTAWVATIVPARRALRIDPSVALRAE
jgi:predicted permease